MRDMTHPEGGIYAAEDADSLDPGSGQKKVRCVARGINKIKVGN